MELQNSILANAFLSALQAIPGTNAEFAQEAYPPEIDAIVRADIAGKKLTLLLELKRDVYPRDAYQMLHHLHYLRNTIHHPIHEDDENAVVPVIVAHSISAGARDVLKRENISFFDSGGSLFLQHDGTFIDLARPPAPAQAKVLRNLYSGARARVVLTILLERERWFGINELSKTAKVSVGTASEVLKALEDLDWVRTRGNGPNKERMIAKPGQVLDSWEEHVRNAKHHRPRRYYIPYLDNRDLPSHLDHHLTMNGVNYAFTSEVAAQHWTPYLTHISQVRARLVWDERAEIAMQAMEARSVAEGANFAVIEIPSEADLLFREQDDRLWYANSIHIYLDLIKAEGRAKDLATFFRQERIRF